MLQIAVHGEDELAGGVIEARRQRRRLTEIPPQLHHQHTAVDGSYLFEELVSAVFGTVIYQHQLKAVRHLFHNLLQAGIQNGDVFLFIVIGHNDGVFRHNSNLDAPIGLKGYNFCSAKWHCQREP